MTTEPGFPTPEEAYADAPRTLAEVSWLFGAEKEQIFGRPMGREFWLRKAALFDRIALAEERKFPDSVDARSKAAAEGAAFQLATFDYDHRTGSAPGSALSFCPDPTYRPYVRQEYARWREQLRGE